MAQHFDPQGRPITLGRELGSGGEGAVFEIAGDAKRVAKIYHRPVPADKADKLRAMASQAADDLTAFASWPLAVLQNGRSSNVTGIVLPRVVAHDEIHNLYSPAHRKIAYPDKDWGFLLHVAMNCAAAFDAIHDRQHVIGDVNQGNLLVSQRGTVFLIDCDSFQITTPGKKFLCEVGVPQYTPPELQGRSFRGLERTANHDRFGLALVIFHLLFMGRHPFAGRYTGRGDMPIEQAIAECRYAFSRQAAALGMARPPQTLAIEDVAPPLAELFERAFNRQSHERDARPTAADWHAQLGGVAKQLVVCTADRGHRFANGLAECPWCKLMSEGAPNFFLSVTFRAATPEMLNLTPEVAALWKAIEQAPRPRAERLPPPPAIVNVVPAPPPPAMESAQSMTRMVQAVAITSLVAMLGMFFWRESGYVTAPIFVVFSVWWLIMLLTSGNRPERHRRRQVLRARRGQLKQLQWSWSAAQSQADNRFKALQKELRVAHDQLARLRPQFENDLRKLHRDVWQRQLNSFLQSKFISDARVDGIGPGRAATLASYGIETAADVEYNRAVAVPGIDVILANNLCHWRSGLERQFTANKSQGVPPQERQALLMKYAQMRQQLEQRLRHGPQRLADVEVKQQAELAAVVPQLTAAYLAVAQAYADLEAISPRRMQDAD